MASGSPTITTDHARCDTSFLQEEAQHSVHSHPVQLPDMNWHQGGSAQIALEMEGMSIKRGCSDSDKHNSSKRRPLRSDATNADSMFAWLSKLLPGL